MGKLCIKFTSGFQAVLDFKDILDAEFMNRLAESARKREFVCMGSETTTERGIDFAKVDYFWTEE